MNGNEQSIGKPRASRAERVQIDLRDVDPRFAVELGRVNYSRAHRPLDMHVHPGAVEFVYVVKGRQMYSVGGRQYAVGSGEVFFTLADEPHSTALFPEDKSLFYYIILDVAGLADGFLGYDVADGQAIVDAIGAMRSRVFAVKPDVKRMLDGTIACHGGTGQYRATVLRNLVSGFLLSVLEGAAKSGGSAPISVRRALDYIDRNLEEEVSLAKLAEVAGLSLSRFKANFRRQVGIPPKDYLLRQRVQRARELLEGTELSITEISGRLCFSSSQYFATVFRRYLAATPGEYRVAARRGQSTK